MTIDLPLELEGFVRDQILAGRYQSEGEVVCEALQRLRSQAPTPMPDEGSIGAMADDAELLEQVTQNIMEGRRPRSLRPTPDE